MLKYAQKDIEDGINSLCIGIGNILAAIIRREVYDYSIKPVNYFILVGAIQTFFPLAEILYSDSKIIVTLEGVKIEVTLEEKHTIFKYMEQNYKAEYGS